MKQPTFNGRVLLPMSVIEAARAGDPLAVERVLRYYDRYINKLCTRTLYEEDGMPHKTPIAGKAGEGHREQKLAKTREAVKGQDERSAPLTASSIFAVW